MLVAQSFSFRKRCTILPLAKLLSQQHPFSALQKIRYWTKKASIVCSANGAPFFATQKKERRGKDYGYKFPNLVTRVQIPAAAKTRFIVPKTN